METKLLPPVLREIVPRDALIELLRMGSSSKLTLIIAPAGWGKTTLLAEWNSRDGDARRFTWLAVDRNDNASRFWTHLIGALRTVEPGIGARALESLPVPGTRFVELGLPSLINEIAALSEQVTLVIDDYHLIKLTDVHEAMAFLIERLPPSLHLVLSTRSDPPLRLARLRASREMTEIRARELQFSEREATVLLNDVLALGLDADEVAQLQRRTEGWPAGLCLAALSIRGRDRAGRFIATFAGDERHVVDYLISEVLAGYPEPVRGFLLRTSVLERFCAPLCDAVTEEAGSALMLEEIERSNSFLVPLDVKREWYRYHHLFGELLSRELVVFEPDSVPELHRRASVWLREEGMIPEAIHHAAAAGDVAGATDLIARHWNDYFNRGGLDTVSGWLEAVPVEALAGDPRLCLARAWVAMDQARVDEAERWIDTAEEAIDAGRAQGEVAALGSDAAMLRAVHGFKVGRVVRSNEAARRVLALEPEGASFARTVAHCILGITSYWLGDVKPAANALEEGLRLARMTANDLAASYALGYSALIQLERDELWEADRLAVEAMGISDAPGFVEHFVTMMGHLARGKVLERRGELAESDRVITRAVQLARRGGGAIETSAALLALAHVRQSRGYREDARELVSDARSLVKSCAEPGTLVEALTKAERALKPVSSEAVHTVAGLVDALTDRELAVLRLLPSGLSRSEIGETLFVSQNTVKSHVRGIYRKLDASSRAEAVAKARELGLL